MSASTLKSMSVDEYLRTEESSPVKREYVGGFVYPLHGPTRAQAGTSQAHAEICGNIYVTLHGPAKAKSCRLYQSDMKLRIEGINTFYSPDVMAVCLGSRNPTATYETQPCLLVEVLLKSTAQNDRLGKYAAYTAIPSLQTYLIVEQQERRVYAYSRQGGAWTLAELASSGSVDVRCLGRRLSLDDIYADIPV